MSGNVGSLAGSAAGTLAQHAIGVASDPAPGAKRSAATALAPADVASDGSRTRQRLDGQQTMDTSDDSSSTSTSTSSASASAAERAADLLAASAPATACERRHFPFLMLICSASYSARFQPRVAWRQLPNSERGRPRQHQSGDWLAAASTTTAAAASEQLSRATRARARLATLATRRARLQRSSLATAVAQFLDCARRSSHSHVRRSLQFRSMHGI